MRRTLGSAHLIAAGVTLSTLPVFVSPAFAQDVPDQTDAEQSATPPSSNPPLVDTPLEPAPDATPAEQAPTGMEEGTAAAAEETAAAEDTAALVQKVEALEAEMAMLKAAQEEAALASALNEEEVETETEVLKLYGFVDMGLQRLFGSDIMEASFNGNALTFVVGNINLYADANPHPDWRALAEIRFTNAPHGNVSMLGSTVPGFESTFERQSTQQFDPHATAANTYMWGGYTVIERAWVEWKRFQQFRLRLGSWFTPFGIWNVDHGQPTLIAATTPQFIQQMYLPLRQTGLQALGSFFIDDWELAYRAWISNGRTELSVQDLNDDKAFGARTFLRKESGSFSLQLGGSYHRGRVANKVIDMVRFLPEVDYDFYETLAYTENVIGADASLDVGPFRFRAEGTAQLRQFDEGKRVSELGYGEPDSWRMGLYSLVAYQLPFWGLEPFVAAEVMKYPQGLNDGVVELAPGLNVRFNPAVTLKMQGTHSWFFKYGGGGDDSFGNLLSLVSRLVVAF